ncbi:TetR/AcrR family transcriptional regulator [Bradyrhizobium jicamae]|uniref:TetR/AcrR family transcriptional regulator n=1 Tax=Bradyrhizobium jicamae TaxID=280332 RepID=A0ABS5FE63_9BRAD|nr:TetR/AcrR family transcriptional regulator [Bradyrhizobium jicamae]MBR0795086.1 TetR/AcrR family transcriptional regulator [Bradyrhizobium jicamae]MBR0936960.1 TetR/AcrR family transcriptional regulator [Bradyrhizobium jicamae]
MSSRMRTTPRAGSEETRNQIKAAAQMLFARNGIDAVTVQQIVDAAGQRNNAALHYHFRTKEELIRQMVVDGATVLDARRRGMLDEMDRRGGPTSIREVMLILIMPVIELGEDERWRGYIRFTSQLQATNPKALREALSDRWNAGYVECFNHLKRMLPLPPAIVEQRLSIMAIYANAVLSAHEAARESRNTKGSRLWGQPFTVENILDMLEAAITCPPSEVTLAKLP